MNNSEAPALRLLQPYVTLAQPLPAPLSEKAVQEKLLHPLPLQKEPLFKAATARRMLLSLYKR